jgi:hypothetical protein
VEGLLYGEPAAELWRRDAMKCLEHMGSLEQRELTLVHITASGSSAMLIESGSSGTKM